MDFNTYNESLERLLLVPVQLLPVTATPTKKRENTRQVCIRGAVFRTFQVIVHSGNGTSSADLALVQVLPGTAHKVATILQLGC